ncbi:MAG TPA: 50S ribosomal protein L19 [Phycisphaerae bacterium]|nr:50S ribosomal protein L19 [Phycisphaerae bacterium]
MINRLIKAVEDSARQEKAPEFKIGDTVTVSVRIVEGDKHRIQTYSGVVIARRGKGMGESFTVRRIVNNEGVERIFPLHSPKIAKVEVERAGHIRRAKLYYLRDRVGKARRVKDAKRTTTREEAAAAAQ